MDSIGLVFDFDGTMCRLFKNYNLSQVVEELHEKMKSYGFDYPLDKDAFEIFEFIGAQKTLTVEQKTELYVEMNAVLVSAETEAVKSCELVNGVAEVLPALKKSGYKIGVATNNSRECVSSFLDLYCGGLDIPVVGRSGSNPELMKPNSWSLTEVLKDMNCAIKNAIFFGDNRRDYECALNADCKFVGIAPTEKKLKRLQLLKPAIEILPDFYALREKLSGKSDMRTNSQKA